MVSESFISGIEEETLAVYIYLVNGVRLKGTVERHDERGIILTNDGHSQLIFTHAIASISPIDTGRGASISRETA